ncbi:hypothetical protein KJ682_07465 [bacterium]|nr:hypothetical protein [bacterium]
MVQAEREALRQELAGADNKVSQQAVLARAGDLLREAVADRLAPHWYGTPWDFNGTTETPGEGAIACGYFVTTLLRDAGVKLERVRLAQQASERIILALVDRTAVKRFSDAPIARFVTAVEDWGPGLYIVGLDCHVGFIVHDGREIRFLHASYVPPSCAVSEPALTSPVLAASRYRVLGKLTGHKPLLEAWLQGE